MLTKIHLSLLLSSIALSVLTTPIHSADAEKPENVAATSSHDAILKQFEKDRKHVNQTIDSTKQQTKKMLELIPEDVWPHVSSLANSFIDNVRKQKGIHGVQNELYGPTDILKFLEKHPDIRQDYPQVYLDLFTLYNKLTVWDVWAQEIHKKIRSSIGTLIDDRYSISLKDTKERCNLFLAILPFLNQYLDYGKPATSKNSYNNRYSIVYKEILEHFVHYATENFSRYSYYWSHGTHTTLKQKNMVTLIQTLKLSFPLLGDMLTRGEQYTRLSDVIEVLYDLKPERQDLVIQALNKDVTKKLVKINDLTDAILFLSILAESDVKNFAPEVVTFTNGLRNQSHDSDQVWYKLREAPIESRGKVIQTVNERTILERKKHSIKGGLENDYTMQPHLTFNLTCQVIEEIKTQEPMDIVIQ